MVIVCSSVLSTVVRSPDTARQDVERMRIAARSTVTAGTIPRRYGWASDRRTPPADMIAGLFCAVRVVWDGIENAPSPCCRSREGPGLYQSMTFEAAEYIRRFLLHVLPKGFH